MSGRWVRRVKHHECSLPSRGGVGSIWRCRCGQSWELMRVTSSPSGLSVTRGWNRVLSEADR